MDNVVLGIDVSLYTYRMKRTRRASSGFTLIELLVVIAIIGLLASVVLASLNSARAKARDARRVADIKQVQLALELYYDDNGRYPLPSGSTGCAGGSSSAVCRLSTALSPNYIPTVPNDPLFTNTSSNYRYWIDNTSNPQAYTILIRSDSNTSWCKINQGSGYPGWQGIQNCF